MFSRRWIINYVLIVLIVLFTWVGNHYDVQTGVQPAKPGVSKLVAEDVQSLEVKTADSSLSLRRDGSGWRELYRRRDGHWGGELRWL